MGSKGSQTSTSTYKPPKEVLENYKYVTDLAKQVSQTPYQGYQGELVAGMTPTQMAGIQNVNQAQGMALPYYQQATSLASDAATAGDTRNFKQSDIDTYMSPYLNNVVGSTMANLEEQNKRQRQDLVGTAISRGAFGGDRGKIAEAELNRQQGLSTGKTLSDLLQGGYSQALGQFNQGIANKFTGAGQIAGYGTGAQQSVLQGAQAQMAAGAQQQAVRQAQNTADYQQFLQQQAYPFQSTQFLANITQGIGGQSGGTSTTTQPGPSMGGQALGFATAMAGMPWSDIRLKENVGVIGKTFDGQPIYKYNLKGEDHTQIGLMAQDVEKRNPDAVHQYKGFKKVDYEEATRDAEKRGHFAYGGVVPHYADGGSINDIIQSLQDYQEPGASPLPYGQYGAPYGSSKSPIFPKESLAGLGGMGRSQPPTGAGGSGIPRAPEIQEQTSPVDALKKGLQAMSPAQTANLQSNMGSLGLGSKGKTLYTAPIGPSTTGDPMQAGLVPKKDESVLEHGLNYLFPSLFKNHGGGVVGRNHYEDGGAPTYKVQPQNLEDMPQYQQALLKAIYGPESGGRYDIMQGGKETFDTSGPHPNRVAQGGESTAAGAGQFINSTWNDVTGGAPMTKPYQDAATLALAKRDFKRRTGQDLDTVLQEQGVTPDVLKALSPTWVALANKPASGAVAAGDMSRGAGLVPPDGEAQPSSLLERVTGMKLSDEARSGILAAGLGMMASRSPFMGVAIGEGGLGGLQTYYNALANKRAGEKQKSEIDVAGRTVSVAEAGIPIQQQTSNIQAQTAMSTFLAMLKNQASGYALAGLPVPEELKKQIEETTKQLSNFNLSTSPTGGVVAPKTDFTPRGGLVPSADEKPSVDTTVKTAEVKPETLLTPPVQPKAETVTPAVPVVTDATTANANVPPKVEPTVTQPTTDIAKPDEGKAFLDALPPDKNPEYLRAQARKNANNPDVVKSFLERADAAQNSLDEQGGAIINGKFVPVPGKVAAEADKTRIIEGTKLRETELVKNETDLRDKYVARVPIASNIVALEQILEKFQTGQLNDVITQIPAIASALGIEVDPSKLETRAQQEAFLKSSLQLMFNQVKALGARVLVSEIDNMKRATPDPNLQPAANRTILGQMKGALLAEDKFYDDFQNWRSDKGGSYSAQEYDRFMIDWKKSNPLESFVEEAKANTPVRGDLPPPDQMKKGYKYIIPADMMTPERQAQYPNGAVVTWNGQGFENERPIQ